MGGLDKETYWHRKIPDVNANIVSNVTSLYKTKMFKSCKTCIYSTKKWWKIKANGKQKKQCKIIQQISKPVKLILGNKGGYLFDILSSV